jgi:acetyltransferase-like isoleucine patch superfamily enzyme
MSVLSRLRALVPESLAVLQLAGCASVGARVIVLGRIHIAGRSRVSIGDDVVLDGRRAPVELNAGPGGSIFIGDGVRIDGGASLESAARITIGARTVVESFAKILDSPFHATRGDRHVKQNPHPVVIEEEAQIGWRAVLLPGARIGRGAVVRPSTVVSHAVAAGCTVLGVPARVVAGARP